MNDIIYTMLSICPDFERTEIFLNFKRSLIKAYRKNLKKGHVLVNGNYSVLFGNPIEMLKSSIGEFNPTISTLNKGEIYNTRLLNNQELLCCRSPHVTIGNILVAKNTRVNEIDTYFNLTDEIVCLNSINDNILERLSGCDFDSDQMLITDDQILLNAAKKNYSVFKVPTSNVHARKAKRYFTPEDQADLDIRTSNNLIGEIINLSQQLNSQLWDKANNSEKSIQELYDTDTVFRRLYFDICQLDVMSCIEIDKAKKEFEIDSKAEIKRIQNRHIKLDKETGLKQQAHFLGVISQIKGYEGKKNVVYKLCKTTMDYLEETIDDFSPARRKNKKILLSSLFKPKNFNKELIIKPQITLILKQLDTLYTSLIQIMKLDNYTYSYSVKCKMIQNKKFETYELLKKYTINQHTMYRLLKYIDNDKITAKKYLFEFLFYYSDLIKEYKNKLCVRNVNLRVQNETNEYDVSLYGMRFKKEF